MFKQPPALARLTKTIFCRTLPGMVCLLGLQTTAPALARHDAFLYGPSADLKTWEYDLPGEGSIRRAPLLQMQRQAIFALYVSPLLLGDVRTASPKVLSMRAKDALALLPDMTIAEPKKIKGVRSRVAPPSTYNALNPQLLDSLRFLRWRLEYFAGDKNKITSEVKTYLAKRNEEATKQGAFLCDDLNALGLDFARQGHTLEAQNLLAFADYVTGITANVTASEAEKQALQAYETHVAQAYSLAQLDKREEASEHFTQAFNYLRPRPVARRPQTDRLRKDLLRMVEEDLIRYENDLWPYKDELIKLGDIRPGASLTKRAGLLLDDKDRQQLKRDIGRLIDIAYLAKMDGRLNEAAYLFRRAFILVKAYLPADQEGYSSLSYDLGETLLWDEKFDDSVYYLAYCVKLRSKDNPLAVTAIDTKNLLGRARLSQGKAKKAQDIFFENLTAVAKRVHLSIKDTDDTPANAKENGLARLGQAQLVQALLRFYPLAAAEERRQIDDGLQGTVDAALPLKQYDVAIEAGEALLKLRSQAVPANDGGMISVLWGLAYTCDSCAKPAEAIKYYSRMIDSYGGTTPTSLAYWYHGRGLDYDLVANHDKASVDIKRAIKLYQEKLDGERDEEARDHLTWTINDLQYNLKMAQKYPAKQPDYAALPDNCRWRLQSFPLKIYVDGDKKNGFGGELYRLVHEAVAIWKDYDGSPIKTEFVDKLSAADIFIERVTVYDDIPYGSAGRTSATFERKNGVDTKVLTRAHVRVYCPSYDGNDWENQDVKMSSFAKIQFKYLLVHELGHVFGLAHSPAGPDIMYWKSCAQKLSDRDMSTVKSIYSAPKSGKGRG